MRITGTTTCIVGNPWKEQMTRDVYTDGGRIRMPAVAARTPTADQDARPSGERAP